MWERFLRWYHCRESYQNVLFVPRVCTPPLDNELGFGLGE